MQPKAEGLHLRHWRADDIDTVYRACQDPAIQRWTGVPSPYLPEHAREYVTAVAPAGWQDGTSAHFAVTDAQTDELLGSCGLPSIDRVRRSAEVGYWVAPWARGRGVATRATRAVSRWAFDELGMKRVIWQAEIGNHASRLVARRAGFRIEGYLRLADAGQEAWVGSLLPGDPTEVDVPELEEQRAAIFGAPQPRLRCGPQPRLDGILRAPDERDIDAMVAACRDPETVRWTTVPNPYERRHAEDFALRVTAAKWARGDGVVYAITDPHDAWVGSIDLSLAPTDPYAGEVGFLVAPESRGRGYAVAALRALAEWGFDELGLARIVWKAHVGNVASRRVAEKAGFTIEGTLRGDLNHRGERKDAWVGGLTR
ncbi:GNAT family N-acetyltransferase [Phytohabitans rumicis]|uniref:N-acetyltransferase domain-containing protein n=1 Tax=Phytohabitans rumicis TaxID=1076125 RepID=A0A6V8L958_9ACTN|nr:GNAT family N-acetyltransferase [Phytohabitans rumicis]GFJ91528.1 hypothetical protein Prum_051700 [Phytohabitans rumicis]